MSIKCDRVLPTSSAAFRRRAFLFAVPVVILALVVSLVMYMTRREVGPVRSVSSRAPQTIASAPTTLRKGGKTEIVGRLREILNIREEAYRSRNPQLLEQIYSTDCPCLESDVDAIRELLKSQHVWDSIATSIEVRSVERIDKRVWSVIAIFRSAVLRIETEDGRLVREEPEGRDVFRFTLVKPRESKQWVLGVASVVEGR
jgi:hypothetical protein